MSNKLLAVGGILVAVVYLALLVLPVSRIPLLDANRQVLVESDAEAYCAGEVYVDTRGAGSDVQVKECVADSGRSTEVDWPAVPAAFCQALAAKGLPVGLQECLQIIEDRQFWFTAKGTLTNSWNRKFPYPLSDLGVPQTSGGSESRTGDREENDREGFDRG